MNDSSAFIPVDAALRSTPVLEQHVSDAPAKRRVLKILLPILVLAAGLVTAFALLSFQPPVTQQNGAAEPPEVQVLSVQPEIIKLSVLAHGVVTPRTETQLAAQVAGQVIAVSPALSAGGFFERNDLLIAIDPRDYDHAIQQAQGGLAQARLRLEKELAEAEQARVEWRALGQGKPSDYALHKPQIAAARESLKSAEADLKQARINRSRTEIRAPYAGRVREKQAGKGQFVAVGEKLARIYASDWVEVRLPITAEELEFVDLPLGDPAVANRGHGPAVELSARMGGQTPRWRGQISRTEGVWDDQTATLHAVAAIENPYDQPPLAVGLYVEARIDGRERAGVYRIPIGALHAGHQVWIADREAKLRLREVTVLKTESDQVLLSAGLNPGERVVVSALDLPVEGMRLSVPVTKP